MWLGRLFQRLEQRIEGGVGDLVGFVEDVDLEAVARRTVARGLAQLADLVDAAIGGGVDLDHIHRIAGANLAAGIANAARLGHGMVLRLAIQRHRQNARDGGLADPAMSAEDVAVRDASLLDGVLQGAGDVVLPDHVGEFLWPVFARENLITHGRKIRLYGVALWNGEAMLRDNGHRLTGCQMESLQLLRQLIDHLPARLRVLPADKVKHKPAPDIWSPKEELGHLLDSAANNHQRIVRAQLEENPAMPSYDGDAWVALHRYQHREWQSLIDLWTALNRQLLAAAEACPIPPGREPAPSETRRR